MESKFLLDALLERTTFFQGQRVCLCDNRDHIDDVREFLEDNDIDGLKSMTGWLDEEETAVNTCILDIAFSLGGEFFAKIGRVLVFDVFDDRIPARSMSAMQYNTRCVTGS